MNILFQQAVEPVFVLDSTRRIVYVNEAWEELTGYPSEAVLGLECLPHGPTADGDLSGLGGSFCPPPEAVAGKPCGGSALIVHAGGERRWRRLEFWPFHDARGQGVGIVGFVRDADAASHAPDSESQRIRAELSEIRDRLRHELGMTSLVGRGPAHRRLLDQVRAAAATAVPVLIVGESGTGKRTVARAIHAAGDRGQGPLVPFDCPALPPAVLERELFGPEVARDAPRLQLPDGSTLLLVEIMELARDLQRLLALGLDSRVRLLATALLEPDKAREQDRLRPDLFFTLTTFIIRLQPLRERLDELPLIAQHFLERKNLRSQRQLAGFDPRASDILASYDWPGNLRELARVVDQAHERAQGDVVQPDDLPATIRGNLGAAYCPPPMPSPITPLDDLLTQVERRLIEQALARARQNKSRAAELLDISRPRLYRRIKELNIPDDDQSTEELASEANTPVPGGP